MTQTTLANWMTPPASSWSFRNVREFIPTAPIHASSPALLASAQDDSLASLEVDGVHGQTTLEDHLAATLTDSMVVLHRGRSVFEWYAPGVDSGDRHLAFSVTKSITGLLAGILSGTGKLGFDAPVTAYVPEVSASVFGSATVLDLLDMRVSPAFSEDYTQADPLMLRYRQASGWTPGGNGEGLHDFLSRLPAAVVDAPRFQYASTTTDMLGWVLERAAGMAFADAVSQMLWTPMGAEADADVTIDPFGAARAAGGLSSTTRDLARVGQLVVDGGRGIVPEAFIADLFNGDEALWAADGFTDLFPGGAYRSCWYDIRTDPGVLYAGGIHGQMIYVDKPRNVVIARYSHWREADDTGLYRATAREMRSVARALGARG